jgi:hypothetical protein
LPQNPRTEEQIKSHVINKNLYDTMMPASDEVDAYMRSMSAVKAAGTVPGDTYTIVGDTFVTTAHDNNSVAHTHNWLRVAVVRPTRPARTAASRR